MHIELHQYCIKKDFASVTPLYSVNKGVIISYFYNKNMLLLYHCKLLIIVL